MRQPQQQQQFGNNQFNNNNNNNFDYNDFDYNNFADNNFNNNIRPRPRPRPTIATTPRPITTTTAQTPQFQRCLRNCPVTAQYDPVCGTNGQNYNNRNALRCARACGVSK